MTTNDSPTKLPHSILVVGSVTIFRAYSSWENNMSQPYLLRVAACEILMEPGPSVSFGCVTAAFESFRE